MKSGQNINIGMILREFWRAAREYKFLLWSSFVCFSAGFIFNIFVPIFYKNFFDELGEPKNGLTAQRLFDIIVMIAIIHTASWIFARIGIFCTNAMQTKISARLKQNSFDYIMLHSRDFFANNFSGSLVQRVNRFARAFIRITDVTLFDLLQLIISISGAIIITAFIAPAISLIIAVWLGLFTAFNLFLSRIKVKYDIIAAAADSKTTGLLADDISNYSSITLFNGYHYESEQFMEVTKDQARKTQFTWDLWTIINAIQVGSTYLIEFLVFYYGIIFWQKGSITLGTFSLIQIYIVTVGQQLWSMNRIIREIYESLADSQEMVEIFALPHEIVDKPNARELKDVKGVIEFRQISFGYNKTRIVLDGINLKVEAGEKVALVGPSGTGKTTLISLLLRIHDPAGGAIFIDGQDTSKILLESLRANISLVPQDPVLFHRTIKDNIRYGRPDATDKEIIEAAKSAHCDEFINGMQQGYDTFVGERGVKLSGGERQRIAIARAILKRAPILVLDEATSSLDSESEILIQDALAKLMNNCTTIAIAHRLSTIRRMDRIIVMENGVIAETGAHQSLIRKRNGTYKHLWDLQAGGFIR